MDVDRLLRPNPFAGDRGRMSPAMREALDEPDPGRRLSESEVRSQRSEVSGQWLNATKKRQFDRGYYNFNLFRDKQKK